MKDLTREFTARAHGRVNLIGEHTDYNGGWVLPTPIPQFTEVTLTRKNGKRVEISSIDTSKKFNIRQTHYDLGTEKKSGQWSDYLQGATLLLKAANQNFEGFEAQIHSSVPEGSGLSSSAALEISFMKAIREAYQLDLSDVELAKLGQRIENEFVGARIGIMDQMACALASQGEALFLDTEHLSYERIPIPLHEMDMLVINSGVAHRNVGGGYNQRRSECEAACSELKIKSLRELSTDPLNPALPKTDNLPGILKRRARHVLTENRRVFLAVEALKKNDVQLLGKLFQASHLSMKNDYEVSIPEIDLLVELCNSDSRVFGARLTGGGFGGSIVAIARKGTATEVIRSVVPEYEKATGQKATVLVGA